MTLRLKWSAGGRGVAECWSPRRMWVVPTDHDYLVYAQGEGTAVARAPSLRKAKRAAADWCEKREREDEERERAGKAFCAWMLSDWPEDEAEGE